MSGKSFKATWLGDGDPQSQLVRMGDLAFVRGQAVNVPADHEFAERIQGNPTFSTGDHKAEVTPVVEPTEEEQAEAGEAGTAKAALKAQLKALGVEVRGNPSEETLRAKLVEAAK